MSDPVFDSPNLSDEEKQLLREKVKRGSEINPIPQIPDAPDITSAPEKRGSAPGTFKNRIEGLVKLSTDEIPVVGKHFVVWGNHFFSDIQARPVVKKATQSEDTYTAERLAEVDYLIENGLKNPKVWTDPVTSKAEDTKGAEGAVEWDRRDRAERYARWRYKGFICGEVYTL